MAAEEVESLMERGTEKCSNMQPTGLLAVREERDNCLFSNLTLPELCLSIFTILGLSVFACLFFYVCKDQNWE